MLLPANDNTARPVRAYGRRRCVWCAQPHHPLVHAIGFSPRRMIEHYAMASLWITVKPEGRP